MNLQSQLVSLELSQKLYEAGVRAESYFYYYEDGGVEPRLRFKDANWHRWQRPERHYPAYSVAELISILGERFGYLQYKRGIFVANSDGSHSDLEGNTPQEAVALLLLHLISSGVIEVAK